MNESLFGYDDPLIGDSNDPWANYPSRQQQKLTTKSIDKGKQNSSWLNYSADSTNSNFDSDAFANLNIAEDPLRSGYIQRGNNENDNEDDYNDENDNDNDNEEGDDDDLPVIGGGDSATFANMGIWSENLVQSFNPLNYHNSDDKMIVKVKEIPEKEGLVFKHINYLISHNIKFSGEYQDANSNNGETRIVRRYSDFAWLVDILWKKYPFRLIPELPPKKFSTTPNNDTIFLQKRRRGIQRFLYQVMKHPILSKENIVIMFLTVPNDFSNWKKFANIDSNGEFDGIKINLPKRFKLNIEKVFEETRKNYDDDVDNDGISKIDNPRAYKINTNSIVNNITQIWSESPTNHKELDFIDRISELDNSLTHFADVWNKICLLVERIEKRDYALSVENQRFAYFFENFLENNHNVYGMENILTGKRGFSSNAISIEETQNLGIINNISKSVATFFRSSKQLKDAELGGMSSQTLENFKKLQDYSSSLHFLLERLTSFKCQSEKDIHFLLNRITKANERLMQIRIKSDVRGSEIDKLTTILTKSSNDLNALLSKIILVKHCFVNEYQLFQKTKYIISECLQDWFVEKVKYGDLQQDLLSKCFSTLQDIPLK